MNGLGLNLLGLGSKWGLLGLGSGGGSGLRLLGFSSENRSWHNALLRLRGVSNSGSGSSSNWASGVLAGVLAFIQSSLALT